MANIDPDSTVTAGNASGQNDGAALAIVSTPDKAAALGLRPLARLAGWAVAGVPSRTMGIGPVPASDKVLGRLGLMLAGMDIIELNEARLSRWLCCGRGESNPTTRDRTGAWFWNLIRTPCRRNGRPYSGHAPPRNTAQRITHYGLETMCIGGGQGLAAVFENVNRQSGARS